MLLLRAETPLLGRHRHLDFAFIVSLNLQADTEFINWYIVIIAITGLLRIILWCFIASRKGNIYQVLKLQVHISSLPNVAWAKSGSFDEVTGGFSWLRGVPTSFDVPPRSTQFL
jgi:hypothetical protein